MKVALIQLPLQSHDYVYSLENIPLAAGYLVSYASAMSAPADFIVCPSDIVNLGGDAAILRWLEEVRPDMVGFGCYVWNIHRTLYLCSLVRQRLERCLIVLGGPEVTPDNDFLLSHESFHFSIVGEGEETFTDLIRSVADGREDMHEIQGLMVRSGRNMLPAGRRGTIRDLGRIPSPYLTGIVGPSLNRNMLMETVRGCPMQCTYCYYHKSSPSVRTFAIDRVRDELSWAISEGLGEVTLIDPCFTRRKDLSSLLEAFASERSETLRFSCELNAEDLDPKIVDALLKAGLAHVEIGLQSTNEKALRNVGRRFDREAFIRGVKMLRSSGVKVMTDIMVGLPGDTLDNVKNSVDFVLAGDLCDELSLYPLSILPGTVLRQQARRFGINHQYEPPYLVTRTDTMSCEDIREAFAYAEDATGEDFFPVELPRMGGVIEPGSGNVVHRIVIDGKNGGRNVLPYDIGQALCIEARDSGFMDSQGSLRGIKRTLLAANPFTLVSWIIPEDAYRGEETVRFLSSLCSEEAHPADQEYMASYSTKRSCRIFLRGEAGSSGSSYTLLPSNPSASMPIWAALPGDAGPEEEKLHSGRMESLLGFRPTISYHDLETNTHDVLDDVLCSVNIKM